eukprot:GHVQ01015923.1.p1 GENE.GHVQ01015923.1~~GHVQ01015923.1.p1  ORF type:complete len:328 (-),score=47.25 GHVQ01015923.1:1090-2073(-)
MSGTTSFRFTSTNVVYIKNLSPLATGDNIREALQNGGMDPDEILSIEFKQFPGSTQRYCQVEFKTSGGVTSATALNGEALLGLPMNISVIDALGPAKTLSPAVAAATAFALCENLNGGSGSDLQAGGAGVMTSAQQQTNLLSMALHNQIANAQAVQLASQQARQLAEQKRNQLLACGMVSQIPSMVAGIGPVLPGPLVNPDVAAIVAPSPLSVAMPTVDPAQSLNTLIAGASQPQVATDRSAESEEQQMARTVHVSNIPITYNEADVRKLMAKLGTVTDMKIDITPETKSYDENYTNRFAIIEFMTAVQAQDAVKRRTLHASSRILE